MSMQMPEHEETIEIGFPVSVPMEQVSVAREPMEPAPAQVLAADIAESTENTEPPNAEVLQVMHEIDNDAQLNAVGNVVPDGGANGAVQ